MCTVGSRQADHKSQRETIKEDDMAKSRVGNTLIQRERDEPIGEEGAVSPRELIRKYQGLAEG